jgi:hypothetical protein
MGDRLRKEAIKLLSNAAKNEKVQAAAVQPLAKAGVWTAMQVGHVGARPVKAYQMQRMAYRRRCTGSGKYSRKTIVCGRRRYVVWKDGVPQRAYPPLAAEELAGRSLAELPELQDFNPTLLIDPNRSPAA